MNTFRRSEHRKPAGRSHALAANRDEKKAQNVSSRDSDIVMRTIQMVFIHFGRSRRGTSRSGSSRAGTPCAGLAYGEADVVADPAFHVQAGGNDT